jgi:hypothetical protein
MERLGGTAYFTVFLRILLLVCFDRMRYFVFKVDVRAEGNNRVAGISGYIGNRRELEEWISVPVGSPVGQNETANNHWLHERTNRRQEPALEKAALLV